MTPAAVAAPARLLEPGRTCWRSDRATRFRCVQDGAEYFRLVRAAILQAQHSIFILGWDIAGGLDLLPGAAEREPTRLKELLDHVARRRPGLRCHVLIWDYAAFYALERDPLSRVRLGWGTHRRVRFRYDDQHPLGASHHQKVIVVDDAIAFVGGIDLTGHRWDTTEHLPQNPLRTNLLGTPYGPYHEVAAMVEGPVAASLGLLARERWRRRGGRRVPPLARAAAGGGGPGGGSAGRTGAGGAARSLWPADTEADLTEVEVAIARTEPPFGGRPAVRECEALFMDSIAAARDAIYIENQYFTNARLGAALGARLREADGPEVIVVGPKECEGWLEHRTMGVLRWKVLAELRASDHHGRLRLCYPLASKAQGVCTFVHSKVMCVDDTLLRIGSANLSSRSMGFDTECDLAVQARGERERGSVRLVRARLLAEHLGADAAAVVAAIAREGSLRGAIDALGHGDRRLAPVEVRDAEGEDPGTLVREAADPEEPSRFSLAVDKLLPEIEEEDRRSTRLMVVLPVLALLAMLLAGWRSTDLSFWLSLTGMHELMALAPRSLPMAATALGLLAAGGLLFLPIELMLLAMVLVFGPLRGAPLALAGAMAGALLGLAAGRALGLRRVAPLIGRRASRLWRLLRGSGFETVAVMRVVSVASNTSIHLLCGAARVPLRPYAGGTLLGLLPGLAAFGGLGAFLRHALLRPGPASAALAAGMAVVLILLVLRVRTSLLLRRLAPSMEEHQERARFG